MQNDDRTTEITHVFVGSKNPAKVNAATAAVVWKWPEVKVVGYEVPSNVSEQPIGDPETKLGSENRAKSALKLGLSEFSNIDAKRAIGIGPEGGVTETEAGMYSTVWVSVIDSEGHVKSANGARVHIPKLIANKIRNGEEMGPIVEQLVGDTDIRKKQGFIGVITDNFVNRSEEYAQITKLAIGLWYGRSWEESLGM